MLAQRTPNGPATALFPWLMMKSDEPALLQRRFHETREQGMRLDRAALELGMELDADEPGMVRSFHDLRQLTVGRHAREQKPRAFQPVLVVNVHLVAMAVPLADVVGAVDRVDDAVAGELRRIGAEPHGAAQ